MMKYMAAVLLFSLASTGWAQVEALVRAVDNLPQSAKGDFITIKESPASWGGREGPPEFIRVEVVDANTTQAQLYIDPYLFELDYTVLTHQTSTDGYRVRLENPHNNLSGAFGVDKAQARDYLLNWSITQVNNSPNDLRFDFGIYNASISRNFWGRDVGLVSFVEFDYDSGSGDHTIDADYSLAGWTPTAVAAKVTDEGGTVVSNNAGIIRYILNRTDVIRGIKTDLTDKFEEQVNARRRYLDPNYVDVVLAGDGTTITTKAEILPFILDRADE